MRTMTSVCIYGYGGPGVLKQTRSPRPHQGRDEVLVRVHAAGVNPVDWKIREGHLRQTLGHTLPLILGWDVSGVVESIGSTVGRFKVGDEVISRPDLTRDGAFAEFICVRESEVAPKPPSMDHVHAAGLSLAGLTAWQALFDAGGLARGQRVLIHAAAGGVGHLAVQLAKDKGAYVIGTASSNNHEFLRELGIDEVIDYRTDRFEEAIQPVDLVLDAVGGDTQSRSWKVLRRGGTLVSIVTPPSAELATAHGAKGAFVFVRPDAAQLAELGRLVDEKRMRVVVETVLPLSEAALGLDLSERGHARGKIVLQVI
jgi:NADPH:quinone reductase-like Zn-dependent oxidoreductase